MPVVHILYYEQKNLRKKKEKAKKPLETGNNSETLVERDAYVDRDAVGDIVRRIFSVGTGFSGRTADLL